MYEAYYGFKEKPFSMLPDPGFLYLSKKHQTALTLLEYGLLNQVGFCVISGEPGAGKTTILRAMLERVGDDITVGLITNTHQSFGGLLDWILSVFDLHKADLTHVEMHQVFMEYLIKEYASNRSVLLIVDEAQNMNADSLEELRMLSNVNSEKDQLLQIVLVGQPALKDILRKPELMQFAQRIAVDYHLAPLNLEETCGYIQHRLVVAGAQRDVFTPAACERIYSYSGGTPRLINLLCETVLVFGFADQLEVIDVDLVEEMVHERMKDSVVPLVNKDVAREENIEASKQLEENFPWIGKGQNEEEAGTTKEPLPITKDVADVKLEEVTGAVVENSVTNEQATSTNLQAAKIEQVAVEQTTPVQKEKPDILSLSDNAVSAITGEKIRPTVTPPIVSEKKRATFDLFKYGVVAVVLALILIAVAVVLKDGNAPTSEPVDDEPQEQIKTQNQHELEDAARKKSEAEKQAREAAEKLAIEQAAAKAELEKEQAEQEKIKQDKIKKEKAVLAAKEKKLADQRLADKKRAEQIRVEQEKIAREEAREAARQEEVKRLKEQLEASKLEREYLEAEREAQAKKIVAPAETGAKQVQKTDNADELAGGWIEEKAVPEEKSAGCSGPTARFKSHCR